MPVLNTYDVIVSTFLMIPQEDGQKSRVYVVKIIDNHKTKIVQDPGHTQFICSVIEGQYE